MRVAVLAIRLVAAAVLGGACRLAALPDASFPCERDADCLHGRCVEGVCRGAPRDAGDRDAGASDAGASDAGASDGGEPDAGLPDAGGPDAGVLPYVNDWPSAASGFTPWDGGITFDSQPCPHFDGGQLWFGAVFAPTTMAKGGQVVGIPKGARRALRVNPETLECTLFGKPLPDDAGSWSSGAFGPDGRIYAAPSDAHQMLRIDPEEEIVELWGPELYIGDKPPGFIGTTVDSTGALWMVSNNAFPAARVDLDGGVTWVGGSIGSWWGVARTESSGRELLVSPPITWGDAGIGALDPRARVGISAGGSTYLGDPPLFGVHPRFDGTLISVGYGRSPWPFAQLTPRSDGGVEVALFDAGVSGIGFSATGSDGEVWSMPAGGNTVTRLVPGAPQYFTVPLGAAGFSTCGVVATPSGLIALPCEGNDRVMRLALSSGERRSIEQLLSPFFNRP